MMGCLSKLNRQDVRLSCSRKLVGGVPPSKKVSVVEPTTETKNHSYAEYDANQRLPLRFQVPHSPCGILA